MAKAKVDVELEAERNYGVCPFCGSFVLGMPKVCPTCGKPLAQYEDNKRTRGYKVVSPTEGI